MTGLQDVLMRGSMKVIEHYRSLLARAETEAERRLYRERIEREQRLLGELRGGRSDRRAA
jgi:hypothetical protein